MLQILEAQKKVSEKTAIYVPYNILPLDPDSSNQAIMTYPEVDSSFSVRILYVQQVPVF